MEKVLYIGLDLSFNCTGICMLRTVDSNPEIMSFHRVLYDADTNKTGKQYKPLEIKNINNVVYRMPTNILVTDLLANKNKNDEQQITSTIRAMICSKKICTVLSKEIDNFKPDSIVVTIENYVMPAFGGRAKLKDVSGLILLQGYVREFFIRLKIGLSVNMRLYLPTPTTNKKYFTGNGKSVKDDMLDVFVTKYDGLKLIPDVSSGKIDDVIDAFSLMIYGYGNENIC